MCFQLCLLQGQPLAHPAASSPSLCTPLQCQGSSGSGLVFICRVTGQTGKESNKNTSNKETRRCVLKQHLRATAGPKKSFLPVKPWTDIPGQAYLSGQGHLGERERKSPHEGQGGVWDTFLVPSCPEGWWTSSPRCPIVPPVLSGHLCHGFPGPSQRGKQGDGGSCQLAIQPGNFGRAAAAWHRAWVIEGTGICRGEGCARLHP